MLAPLFVWLLLRQAYPAALWVFLIASASDALDGFLARRFNLVTQLGAILDPLADKLLVASGILALAWVGALPWWLAVIVVLRDAVIVIGGVAYRYATGSIEMKPLPLSKLNTAMQFLLVLMSLATHAGIGMPRLWLGMLVWLTLTTTLASGVQYVRTWMRKGRRHLVG